MILNIPRVCTETGNPPDLATPRRESSNQAEQRSRRSLQSKTNQGGRQLPFCSSVIQYSCTTQSRVTKWPFSSISGLSCAAAPGGSRGPCRGGALGALCAARFPHGGGGGAPYRRGTMRRRAASAGNPAAHARLGKPPRPPPSSWERLKRGGPFPQEAAA